ncbi:MAG: TIGR04282 family arsenosugar biosynthesis glycosyltransferase [Planctomycetota bacterium]
MSPATVVILTKLAGHLPVKTRLHPVLGKEAAERLYEKMLAQTIALARRIDPRPTIAYSPPDADPGDFPGCSLLPVAGDDGAICLENALREAFTGTPLVALGGDAPDLPPERLEEVVRKLEDYDAVFVPTFDGGFSCLGLRKPVPGLARGFAYGSDRSLDSLDAFLGERGLRTTRLEGWPDVDTPEDLQAYRDRTDR